MDCLCDSVRKAQMAQGFPFQTAAHTAPLWKFPGKGCVTPYQAVYQSLKPNIMAQESETQEKMPKPFCPRD